MDLDSNGLTGGVPAALADLASLEHLLLDGNSLSGKIPPELGRLNVLEILHLDGNRLGGELPYTFLELEDLKNFWFRDNNGLCAPTANAFTVWLNDIGSWSGPRCPFDLDMWFTSSVSSTVRSHLEAARAAWAGVLRDTELSDITFNREIECGGLRAYVGTVDDHLYWVHVDSIDGRGGTLAYAGYCRYRTSDDSPIVSRAVFDEDDIDRMLDHDALVPVGFHELAHALGFLGYHWDKFDLLEEGSDAHFTGRLAIQAFDDAGGDDYDGNKVPIQLEFHNHWRESVFRDEMMSPFINLRDDDAPVSAITLQSMAAIGYEVDVSLADDYELADPSLPPPAKPGEEDPAVFDLGHDVEWGPLTEVDNDGRVIRVIPPPPGAYRGPLPRRDVRVEPPRPLPSLRGPSRGRSEHRPGFRATLAVDTEPLSRRHALGDGARGVHEAQVRAREPGHESPEHRAEEPGRDDRHPGRVRRLGRFARPLSTARGGARGGAGGVMLNAATIEAMREARMGNLPRFATVEDLFDTAAVSTPHPAPHPPHPAPSPSGARDRPNHPASAAMLSTYGSARKSG